MPCPPVYCPDLAGLERAKGWACPHCGAVGQLNRHGSVRGLAEDGSTKRAVRGQRFLCSKRGRRRGCGRTVAVLVATVLKHASVRTGAFWRFVQARLGGQSVAAAWATAATGFSLESAYRWWRRWRGGEAAIRTLWCRGRDPPEAAAPGAILTARYGAVDPMSRFQCHEQRGWP